MSVISSGTTLTTALVQTGDTNGNLVFKTGASGTTALTLGSDQSATFAGAVNITTAVLTNPTINGNVTTTGLNFDSDTFVIDATNNRVGVGNTTSGFDSTAYAVIGSGASDAGVAIYTSNATAGYLQFADGTSGAEEYKGFIKYDHSTNAMSFSTNSSARTDAEMTINSSGNVGIGTSSPSGKLQVDGASYFYGAGAAPVRWGDTSTLGTLTYNGSDPIIQTNTGNLLFWQGTTERMRITDAGEVLIGTTLDINSSRFQVAQSDQTVATFTNTSGGYVQRFLKSRSGTVGTNTIVQNGDTIGGLIFQGADGTGYIEAASIFAVVNGTPGTNDMPGALLFRTTADGASSATERMRIDAAGTLLVGKTSILGTVNGCTLSNGVDIAAAFTGSNAVGTVYINRQDSDGVLITLRQAGTQEGTISVSGTTVSYNGGHLARFAQTLTAKDESILKGTVLSNLDEMNEYTKPTTYWVEEDELPEGVIVGDVKEESSVAENEQLNKVKVSDVEGDVNVAGVFVNWYFDEQHNVDEINMAMTGDMIIRIAEGVTVQRGDLLMSAGDGTAKPQGDDIVRGKTIAKVTSTNITCTYADGSYCVPCVLMAC
jgi:hypothetical protein